MSVLLEEIFAPPVPSQAMARRPLRRRLWRPRSVVYACMVTRGRRALRTMARELHAKRRALRAFARELKLKRRELKAEARRVRALRAKFGKLANFIRKAPPRAG